MNAPVILAFEILAQRYEDPDEFLYHLGALKDYQADPISRITICSLADAKGYEYDRVCILDCIRGILPQKEDSQKERMLFYHGMTRAKHELEFFASKRLSLIHICRGKPRLNACLCSKKHCIDFFEFTWTLFS